MVTGMEAVGNDYIVLSDSTGVIRVYTYSPENEFIVVAEEKCGHPIHTMQRSNFNRLFAVQLDSDVCLTCERGFASLGFLNTKSSLCIGCTPFVEE